LPSRSAVLVTALALATLGVGLVPPAAAHCPNGQGAILGAVSTCQYNDEAEVAVAQANASSQGNTAFVLVKDKSFHPPVVTIKSGGTIVFVYADSDQSEQHDPRGSGRCGNAVDPLALPEKCVPSVSNGPCFDVVRDDGTNMVFMGQTYPVTLKYTSGSGLLQKSRGLLSGSAVGDLTGAQPFSNCPSVTHYAQPTQAVIPYHCGLHGTATTGEMRGTIVVKA
jgi:plastocyanin